MNNSLRFAHLSWLVLLTVASAVMSSVTASERPNVLFIVVDDLNDWTGYLDGHPQARTPNIDALSERSVTFTKSFCNSPSCNPSRASMLTGKHPNSTGMYTNILKSSGGKSIDLRKYYPNAVTLPQYFRSQGYSTFRSGKIFHHFGDWVQQGGQRKDVSFDRINDGRNRVTPGDKRPKGWPLCGIDFTGRYCDWGAIDQPYEDFVEYDRAMVVAKEIEKTHSEPFFIACGFYLPHLPWYYPKTLLQESGIAHIANVDDVKEPVTNPNDLDDIGKAGLILARSADFNAKSVDGSTVYDSWHHAITANGKWKEAVQAYLTSIYFVDMQVGRVLDALERSPHRDNTIVVLCSDHGWMLGEKEAWSKYKPWEESVRTNLMIHAPEITPSKVERTVSLIDLFPTLLDLCEIPIKKDLDGRTLTPLMKNPNANWDYPVVTAHDDWNGGWQSVRDSRYRYIRYMKSGEEELYDMDSDPYGWHNLASNPSHAETKNRLRQLVPAQMTALGTWKALD